MNAVRYMLEWRGTQKGPWTIAEIEHLLDTGDLHSLHKIRMDGRWLVLRDFLEEHRLNKKRAAAAEKAAAFAMPSHVTPPAPRNSPPPPPVPVHRPTQESHLPAQEPLYTAKERKFKFPVRTPALILGSVGVTCIAIAAGYLLLAGIGRKENKPENQVQTQTQNQEQPQTKKEVVAVAENKPKEKPQPQKLHPSSFTGKEFYPSLLISTATIDWNGGEQVAEDKKTDDDAQLRKNEIPIYGDENSWLGIYLEGVKKGAQVSVEITADGFMKPSKWQGQVTKVGEDGVVAIRPKIMWNFDALKKAKQQLPVNVNFSASIDDKPLQDVSETYTMRSINDCPLYIKDKSGRPETDLSYMFAAYVNESHPQIQEILKEALECRVVEQFTGYQSKDPKQVLLQVFAIWNALQRRGIKYSSVTYTPPGDRVHSQSVRFLHESIDNHQANCVDGSVLMASVLQKIGIDSYLVIVPGHCFLAFDLVKNSAAMPSGLETTLLGKDNITEVAKMATLPEVEQTKENNASVKTFLLARQDGDEQIQGCVRNLQQSVSWDYKLISIKDSREMGINPIPYTSDK